MIISSGFAIFLLIPLFAALIGIAFYLLFGALGLIGDLFNG